MNMIAGDFVQVYNAKSQIGRWDAIATCFFIDCANNVLEYLEIIHKILKPGGLWINMGPLLYHFSDLENENSIEPSYECLRKIIEKIGFKFLKEQVNVQAKYSQNALSMQQLEYNCVYFVCKKNDE
jgi:carnosine N-methyltransferase